MRKPDENSIDMDSIYQEYASLVYRFLYSYTHDAQWSEELMQETFLRAWQAAPGPEDRSPSGFMFTALRNVCLDMLRRRHPRAHISLQTESAHEPLDTIDHRDTIGRVRQVMAARLSARERQVFELYTFGQLDYAEIAARLETSVESVRTAMSRARKIIKEYCSDI